MSEGRSTAKRFEVSSIPEQEALIQIANSGASAFGLSQCSSANEVAKVAISAMNFSEQEIKIIIEAYPLLRGLDFQVLTERYRFKRKDELLALYKKAKSGYAYLFHVFDDIYKIGKTTNATARELNLRTAAWKYLERDLEGREGSMIHLIYSHDCSWLEEHLHDRFRAARIWDELIDEAFHDFTVTNSRNFDRIEAARSLSREIFRFDASQIAQIKELSQLEPDWWNEAKSLVEAS